VALEHALHCGCRAITPSIAELLKANGYEVPGSNAAKGYDDRAH